MLTVERKNQFLKLLYHDILEFEIGNNSESYLNEFYNQVDAISYEYRLDISTLINSTRCLINFDQEKDMQQPYVSTFAYYTDKCYIASAFRIINDVDNHNGTVLFSIQDLFGNIILDVNITQITSYYSGSVSSPQNRISFLNSFLFGILVIEILVIYKRRTY